MKNLDFNTINALVCKYRVCWQVFPVSGLAPSGRRTVAYELELSGTPPGAIDFALPTAESSQQAYEALREIAQHVMPQEQRASRCDVSAFAAAVRFCEERHYRPDVLLSIMISHWNGGSEPIDACQKDCLVEMKRKLQLIGARNKCWESAWSPAGLRCRFPSAEVCYGL